MVDAECTRKQCSRCGETKPIDAFYRHVRGKHGRQQKCKACFDIEAAARYEAKAQVRRDEKAAELAGRIASSVKRCAKCETVKGKDEFSKSIKRKDGLNPFCKDCMRWYRETRKAELREYFRQYSRKNSEKISRKNAEYRAREYARDRARVYAAEYQRERRKDSAYRLRQAVTSGVYRVLKERKAGGRSLLILGYSAPDLLRHIERQFVGGMNWDNYGEWHLDHIVPLADFDFSDGDFAEVRRAWALPNLRPAWATENIRKSNKRVFLV